MKMKHTTRMVILAALGCLAAFGITSCGVYSRVLKSGDPELMYQTGLQMYQQKRSDKAIGLFDELDRSLYYRNTPREDTIKFYLAVSYFNRKDYFSSNELLNQFRRNFRQTPFMEEAEYLIALGYYYSSPEPELDQNPTKLAIVEFNQYLARYPYSIKQEDILVYLDELQDKLYEKSYLNAKVYYTIGSYRSAIHAFRLAIAEYSESPYREEMMFLLTKSCYTYAENSIEAQQRSRYLDMIDAYYDLISDYPDGKYAQEAVVMYERAQDILQTRYDETIERRLEQPTS